MAIRMFKLNALALKLFAIAFCAMATASAALAQTPALWNATATYAVGNVAIGSDTNTYRCVAISKAHNPIIDVGSYWELAETFVPTTLVVGVGQRFTKLETAWAFIRHTIVSAAADVEISISTQNGVFNETLTAPINLDHAYGSHISIVGESESEVKFSSGGGVTAFTLDSNDTFGGLYNITLDGVAAPGTDAGISLNNGATLYGQNVTINSFYNGIALGNGSKLIFLSTGGTAGLDINGCFNAGAQVETGSYLDVPGLQINLTGSGQYGLYVADKSHVTMTGGVHHTTISAVFATTGSSVNIPSSTIDTSVIGIHVQNHSDANAQLTRITATSVGVEATLGSTVTIASGGSSAPTPYLLTAGPLSGSAEVNNLGKDGSYIFL